MLYGSPGKDKVRIPLSDYKQGCFYSTQGVLQWKEAIKQMVRGENDSPEGVLIRSACCIQHMCELIRIMYSNKANQYDMHRAITISFDLAHELGVDVRSPRGSLTATNPVCSTNEACGTK